MDLTALLEKNKSRLKSGKAIAVRKPADIAEEDRPYSSPEPLPIHAKQSESDIKNTESSIESMVVNPSDITVEKPTTNRQQSDNKLKTNWQQSGNKVATKSKQTMGNSVIKNENRQQSGNTTDNTTDNKVVTKWQQTGNKPATNTPFSKLVGLQREIVIFICHECKNSRSRITEALTLEYIANSLKHSAGAIKTTIQRLEQKACLIRVEFKNGRGGWSRYEVPDNIYHDVIRIETGNKLATNREQTGNKVASQPATEPATSASCSSSKYIKTTTTGIGEEWNFDITPYAPFGFTKTQIKQLAASGVISAADVEQSLIEFSYDINNNALPSIKTTKINFLMGLLWKGQSYVSEGFKNEQDAMILEMARRNTAKRESLLKAKFEAWMEELHDEQKQKLENKMPTHLTILYRTYGMSSPEVREWLFNYYLAECANE